MLCISDIVISLAMNKTIDNIKSYYDIIYIYIYYIIRIADITVYPGAIYEHPGDHLAQCTKTKTKTVQIAQRYKNVQKNY